MVPLLRDGHVVVGLDHSPAMLARAAAAHRPPRAPRRAGARCWCAATCATLRVRRRASPSPSSRSTASSTWSTDADLAALLPRRPRGLIPGGWLAFDVLRARPDFLACARGDPDRRWAAPCFATRPPGSAWSTRRTTVSTSAGARCTIDLPLPAASTRAGARAGPSAHVRLCHRQLGPAPTCAALLARARRSSSCMPAGATSSGRRCRRESRPAPPASRTRLRSRAASRASIARARDREKHRAKRGFLRRRRVGISLDRGPPRRYDAEVFRKLSDGGLTRWPRKSQSWA